MSIFRKFFGAETSAAPAAAAQPAPRVNDPAKDPNMIKVYDAYGRELFITRQNWLDSVLKGNIEKAWSDPDQLASLILALLKDEFFEDAVRPAERLVELTPDVEYHAVLLGIAYLKNKRLDDAERTLSDYIRRRGETGSVLTNLAKVYTERGEHSRSLDTLWRGLRLDPNQDNGLGWFAAIHREQGGEEAGLEALRRVAAVRGSWRAQLWLARTALQQENLPEAIRLYHEALGNAPEPSPADLLTQMSGDLGNHGHLAELLELAGPRFNVVLHGLEVGNNLVKAYVDTGRLDEAKRIVADLYGQKRQDWQQTLNFWETEIAKRNVANEPVPADGKLKMAMLTGDGPIWLAPNSPAGALFPKPPADVEPICFLGSTAELSNAGDKVRRELSTAVGQLSRALPLFLAEQIYFHAASPVRTLMPWIAEGQQGFVMMGVPWPDTKAVNLARNPPGAAQIVVVTHIKASCDPWQITARVIRCADVVCLGEFRASGRREKPSDDLQRMASDIEAVLASKAGLQAASAPPEYQVPQGASFADYLLRLEQLLATRCSNMEGANSFLHGEREIIGGNLRLCASQPNNVTVRILLLRTLQYMKKVAPTVVAEHRETVRLLQREHPLPERAQSAVDRMLSEILDV